MRLFFATLVVALVYTSPSFAEYKNIDKIMTDAARDGSSLVKLLEDIKLAPAGKTAGGENLMEVVTISKGSVYEKLGIKAGDFVTSSKLGSSKTSARAKTRRIKARRVSSPQKSMELYQKLKTSKGNTTKNPGYSSLSFRGQTLNDRELHLYRKFNLKAGDTIVMFNGKPLSSPQDAMSLYQKIKKNEVSQLLIKRGNDFKFLSLKR